MSEPNPKPVPLPSAETRAFWEACARDELTIQRCRSCGHPQHYPRVLCSACHSGDLATERVSGNGTIRTFTINRVPVSEAFAADVPYVVALVQLEEGPMLMSNITGIEPEAVQIGQGVTVCFETRGDQQLPQFRPCDLPCE